MRIKKKFQLRNYWLIQYQILWTNIRTIVRQTVRRITNEIVGVKGLKFRLHSGDFQKVSPTKMLKEMGQDYI